jgi:hypothetical protein
MALYAFLLTPVQCPSCGQTVTDELWFRWGYCRGRAPAPESTYRPDDPMRWRECGSGKVPPWTQFGGESDPGGGNMGSPDIPNLLVRDLGQSWLFEDCRQCGVRLHGGVVEIRNGRVRRGRLARPSEFGDDTLAWWSVDDSAAAVPLFGADVPTDYVADCGPDLRLWSPP